MKNGGTRENGHEEMDPLKVLADTRDMAQKVGGAKGLAAHGVASGGAGVGKAGMGLAAAKHATAAASGAGGALFTGKACGLKLGLGLAGLGGPLVLAVGGGVLGYALIRLFETRNRPRR